MDPSKKKKKEKVGMLALCGAVAGFGAVSAVVADWYSNKCVEVVMIVVLVVVVVANFLVINFFLDFEFSSNSIFVATDFFQTIFSSILNFSLCSSSPVINLKGSDSPRLFMSSFIRLKINKNAS